MHTDDGGGTWVKTGDTGFTLLTATFATPPSGWAVALEGNTLASHTTIILHTEDGGGTWAKQPSGTGLLLHSLAFVTPQSG